MRDFWIEVEIDGRKTKLRGGPRSNGGWMEIRIYAKNALKQSETILYAHCHTEDNMRRVEVTGCSDKIVSELPAHREQKLIKLNDKT